MSEFFQPEWDPQFPQRRALKRILCPHVEQVKSLNALRLLRDDLRAAFMPCVPTDWFVLLAIP
ncbi:hypothetical protein HKCCSP123_13865 [Rhodobacterales bacterium HKCCSP123]|nr:hypothetical protein [Rhodobacterales bacterium HKCCSP123]